MASETTAQRLAFALERAGMTGYALAQKVGVNRGTVSRWLAGQRGEGGLGNLAWKVAEVLAVNESWLQRGGEWIAPGEQAPELESEEHLDVVELVRRYPHRWTPLEVAVGITSSHLKGRPEHGWKDWLDDIKKKGGHEGGTSDGERLARKIESLKR